jgi:kelch-like protein 10
MTQILDYVYTGQIDMNHDNVYDLFLAADYLSILCLLKVCCAFLKQTLDFQTCIGVMLFAR